MFLDVILELVCNLDIICTCEILVIELAFNTNSNLLYHASQTVWNRVLLNPLVVLYDTRGLEWAW